MNRTQYLSLFAAESDAIEFENSMLQVGEEFLPECAKAILADSAVEPSPEYWSFLIKSFREAREEDERLAAQLEEDKASCA